MTLRRINPAKVRDPGGKTRAGRLARMAVDQRGATAVEFAFVALPFIMMIFVIIELSLVFLVNLTLENAVSVAARQIRTGQTQASGIAGQTTVNAFRAQICANMSWLQTQCASGLTSTSNQNYGLVVDIRDPSSFQSSGGTPNPINAGVLAQYDGTKCFYSGNAGGIVVMTVYYPWNLMTPYLYNAFYHLSNGSIVVQAAEVFKNEPYQSSSNGSGSTC